MTSTAYIPQEKVKAIKEAPEPKNLAELRAFLGIVNYYGKFLPHLSTTLKPLYNLLSKQAKFIWGSLQAKKAKKALQADSLLVHYDSAKPLVLSCDASPYGLGAVLSHVMDNGEERPIAYMSCILAEITVMFKVSYTIMKAILLC